MTPDGQPGPLRGGRNRCEQMVDRHLCAERATWWTGSEYRCATHRPADSA